jgi:hypothetical protein
MVHRDRWEEDRRLWITERLPIAELARRFDLDRKTAVSNLKDEHNGIRRSGGDARWAFQAAFPRPIFWRVSNGFYPLRESAGPPEKVVEGQAAPTSMGRRREGDRPAPADRPPRKGPRGSPRGTAEVPSRRRRGLRRMPGTCATPAFSMSLYLEEYKGRTWLKVEKSLYQYQTDVDGQRWIVCYDYLRYPAEPHPGMHVQVRGSLTEAVLSEHAMLERIHFPTGRVSLEALIRPLIKQFHVPTNTPTDIWRPALRRARRHFSRSLTATFPDLRPERAWPGPRTRPGGGPPGERRPRSRGTPQDPRPRSRPHDGSGPPLRGHGPETGPSCSVTEHPRQRGVARSSRPRHRAAMRAR